MSAVITVVRNRPIRINSMTTPEHLVQESFLDRTVQDQNKDISRLLTRRSELQCQIAKLEIINRSSPKIKDLRLELHLLQSQIDDMRPARG